MNQDKEFILKTANERKVKFIRLWFTDILGFLKSFAITINELHDALEEGVRFDGSTLHGFVRSSEEEMVAMPDLSTFQILPWRPRDNSVARMFCNIYTTDMVPYEGDVRYILKQNMKKAAEKNLTFYTGPEIEFFLFKNANNPDLIDRGGYFDLTPLDIASDFRRQMVLTLEEMGVGVISSHHEGAHSQHEIDLRHDDALTTADNIMTFKLVTKEISQLNNIYASFMPKPLSDQNGSGMHIHQSLFKDDDNIFFDKKDAEMTSDTGKKYIAGLLKHAREFFAISNQWVNSYKRLNFGFEAPMHISWSHKNPYSLVRLVQRRIDKPSSLRAELRNPDSACNPYLLFSVILAAGLKGIEENYSIPDPVESHESFSSTKKLEKAGYEPLPTHLHEAIQYFENSQLMKDALGPVVHELFVENKYHEIDQYNRYITDYEINTFLPLL